MSKGLKILTIIFGIFMIIGGICCMFTPVATAAAMGYVVGFCMIIDSIGRFASWGELRKAGLADGWRLTAAILSLVFGFFILNSAYLQAGIDLFIIYYVAIWFIALGILVIARATKMKKIHNEIAILGKTWYVYLILGILLVAFGILCCCKPAFTAATIGVFIGLGIIVCGADMISIATIPDGTNKTA